MNLKFKFSLLISLIILFIFVSTTLLLTILRTQDIQRELIIRDKITAERIIPDLSNDLGNYYVFQFDTYTNAIRNLLNQYPDLLHFRILNPQGELIVDSLEITTGKYVGTNTRMITDKQILSIITAHQTFQDITTYNGEKTIRIFTPYIDNYGTYRLMIEFNFSLRSIRLIIWQTINFLLFLALISICIGVTLTYIFVSRITQPIQELTEGALEISKGNLNYTITTVRTHDELGKLTEVFNLMARQLKDLYAQLESLVAQRTQELSEAKKALEQKLDAVEETNSIMVGRELKMIELKKEIEQLKTQLQEKIPT